MNVKTKNQVQVEQQILHMLAQVIEAFPQYTVSQHLLHVLRKKTDTKEPYFWSEELLLRKLEEYNEELVSEFFIDRDNTDY